MMDVKFQADTKMADSKRELELQKASFNQEINTKVSLLWCYKLHSQSHKPTHHGYALNVIKIKKSSYSHPENNNMPSVAIVLLL